MWDSCFSKNGIHPQYVNALLSVMPSYTVQTINGFYNCGMTMVLLRGGERWNIILSFIIVTAAELKLWCACEYNNITTKNTLEGVLEYYIL